MRIRIDERVMDIKAVWLKDPERGVIRMIDQRYLPWKLRYYDSDSVEKTFYAIKNFVVRGAPTIGGTAALGAYQAVLEASRRPNKFGSVFKERIEFLKKARPTAYNLFHALDTIYSYVMDLVESGEALSSIIRLTRERALEYIEKEILDKNRKIGEYGEKILEDGSKVLTHCNAGALAAVDIGTATAPIYYAHEKGKKIIVYVDETRPWLQGARLTAWELHQQGIETYVISDNAAGYLMWLGEVDVVIVGADRIAVNGDTANKIGTYKLALAAHDNGVPFYVAAPTTTIDPTLSSGREIPIEERSEDEVHFVYGELNTGELSVVRITPKGVRARNPVFDVTPSYLITGFITELGIIKPSEIRRVVSQG